jgi:iron complex transport system substrate-binding protein
MRIVSLVPSATEILFALGLGEQVVGVTHECDYPAAARTQRRVARTVVDAGAASAVIDRQVRAAVAERRSLYVIDEEALQAAAPDLIVTQSLCEVCAVDGALAAQALAALPRRPDVLALHPHTVAAILQDIRRVGAATGRAAQAAACVERLQRRLDEVQRLVSGRPRPRVCCLEWLEPPMASGHWVPEQAALAGGEEVLGRPGEVSRYVTWSEIAAAQPHILVVMPCGFPIARTRRELEVITRQPLWQELPAVRDRRVYLVDGPAYFNRSGPRVVDGVELLAGLLHPQRCGDLIPCGAVEPAEHR